MSKQKGKKYWQRIISDYEDSNLTQETFSRKHKINVWTLRSWLYRIRRERRVNESVTKSTVQFVEVETEEVAGIHNQGCCVRLGSAVIELDTLPHPQWIAEVALAYGEQETY